MLIGYFECEYEDEKESLLNIIKGRFYNIVKDLELDKYLLEVIDKTIIEIKESKSKDFVLSRGEYLSSIIMAEYLDFKFLDAKDIICFHIDGELDLETSYKRIRENLDAKKKYVIPGFYGIGFDNEIKTFERGGSAITGSLIAGAMKSDIYENWTDVDGLMDKDPSKYTDAELIEELSYEDFLKISLNGDQIYHIDAIKPVMSNKIPINIKNTNNPSSLGTIIGKLDSK